MTTPEFEDYYNRLNPQQRLAVDTIEGPVMVVAGPGTGKTQVLTLRIANILLNTDINPANILALTFTESAVSAMRKRLVDIIGEAGYRVSICTFHSFCNDIIRDNPEDFPHLISSVSITELEQIQILQDIILNSQFKILKPFGDPLYYIRSLLSVINELKKEGVSPAQLSKAVRKQQQEFAQITDLYYETGINKGKKKGKYLTLEREIAKNLELSQVYERYQQQLVSQKFYDYNDMILEVMKAMELNPDLLLRLQEQYQYILVDEHQDTNASQNKIIELLGNFYDNPNLFVVGDEKQAIYRFQGASLENFLYFKTLYPKAVLINLNFNYRSTQTVLDAADSLISKNKLPEALGIKRVALLAQVRLPEEKIRVVATDKPEDEYAVLAEEIKQKLNTGIKPQEIAVIFRNNRDVFPVISSFEQHDIPFFVESDQDLLSDLEVKKFLKLLLAIENFGEDVYLVPILHLSFLQIDPLDVFKLIKYSQRQELSIYELLSDPEKLAQFKLQSQASLIDLYQKLKRWHTLRHDDCLENLFIDVLHESGLLAYLMKRPDVLDKLDKLKALYIEMKTQCFKNTDFNLADFLNYLKLLQTHHILIAQPHPNSLIKSVHLMTAHKSKGLEFEYVYIINVTDKHWGNKRRFEAFKVPWEYLDQAQKLEIEADQNEDERRLFYVAMTRAKKQITITYSKVSPEGREQLPSQFVEEIDPVFKEVVEINRTTDETISSEPSQLEIFAPHQTPGLGLKDKEFFEFLFESEGLSVSGLNNYLKCPWKYFYENLIHIPSFKDKQQIFGTAIHSAICKFQNTYQAFLQNKSMKDPAKVLVNLFEAELKKQSLSKLDREELLTRGSNLLENYLTFYAPRWDREVTCEFDIRGVYLESKVKINGRIDRIEKIPQTSEVIVYDLKTGKPKTRGTIEGTTQTSSGDYLRQLDFYKLLLDHYDNGRMKAKWGVIDFLEPDQKGNFHQEQFEYDPNRLEALIHQIIWVAEQIRSLSFWDQGCHEETCEYCQLRQFLTD